MKVKILIGLFIVSLSGCSGFLAYQDGTFITLELEQSLALGKITQNEIKSMIGYPDKIIQGDDEIQYIYHYTEINHIAPNLNEETTIEFSKKGVYQRIFRIKSETSNSPFIDW